MISTIGRFKPGGGGRHFYFIFLTTILSYVLNHNIVLLEGGITSKEHFFLSGISKNTNAQFVLRNLMSKFVMFEA